MSGIFFSSSPPVVASNILRFRTALEISTSTPEKPDWVIAPYVAVGSITELVGKAKAAGKTTFLMHAISSVLSGGHFLDWPTKKTPVVYLTEEREQTFNAAARRSSLNDRADLFVMCWYETQGYSWPEVVQQARSQCQKVGAKLLIVDTISQFAGMKGDSENNAGDALTALQPLLTAATDGIGIVVVRHERKSGGNVGESGRGSTAFSGAVDTLMSLKDNGVESVREVHGIGRYDETPKLLVVRLTPDGYVIEGTAKDWASQRVKDALRKAPATPESALTNAELCPEIGRTTFDAVVKECIEEGWLQRVGRGVKGNPYRYWRTEEADEEPVHSRLRKTGVNE